MTTNNSEPEGTTLFVHELVDYEINCYCLILRRSEFPECIFARLPPLGNEVLVVDVNKKIHVYSHLHKRQYKITGLYRIWRYYIERFKSGNFIGIAIGNDGIIYLNFDATMKK